ncbi:hypothetical protein [Hymenobacter cellulosilyticus]|uniref:Uncharacterized protein n=1 Tax=Hymenobacter cellulosilyticus TaxID=2932248 RepID=A0A8T9PY40_9BACT|nr:hypothetical protein [Hymenobacter cellulosilyticus]UOQ70184.1 hypothetical protein MUN79_15605 [Hymenobacter cellulosilyticus]
MQGAGNNLFFPIGIYGAFTSATTQSVDLVQFEKAVLSPIRKAVIEKQALPHLIMARQRRKAAHQGGLAAASAGDTLSTSPQGLMVTIDAAQAWTSLILAKNAGQGTADGQTMAFYNLNAKLQSAFQTNQQFLVIGLDKILGDFQSEITLEGWPFRINVPKSTTNGQFNNVLIFKFCAGSLAERVANPAQWTNATDVNDTAQSSLAELASWLDAYVKDGIKKGHEAGDPDFMHFADIVTNSDWNGILALKTDIGIKNFPSELQGLLAGIDLSQFNAHHFGINANHILTRKDPATGQVSISMEDKSSMFGLIYYVDPAFAPYAGNIPAYKQTLDFDPRSAFNFKTLMLKVLFENSKIKSFKSFVQLSIYQLFGSEVTETAGRDNILILSGSYEDHNGLPSYSFTGSGRDMIPLANPAFKTVEVVRSSFSTLLPSATQQADRMVYAQFALWGYLNFAALQNMDLLSFGSDGEPVSTQGLAYSQLLVRMSFSLDTPAVKTFAFDAGGITFDVSASRTRRASLFNHFPVKLTGLVSGNADQLPAKLDFIKVQTPTLTNAGDPTGDWYGLVYDLNLGTPGALASSAGFKSSLLLAWSVSDGAIYTGLKLPGMSSQSKLLSLQGVLGLDIASVKLLLASPEPGETATAYLLMLNKVALKFLSKKFPAGGTIDFYLFGDPNNQAQLGSMGWYAAYQKAAKKAARIAKAKKK